MRQKVGAVVDKETPEEDALSLEETDELIQTGQEYLRELLQQIKDLHVARLGFAERLVPVGCLLVVLGDFSFGSFGFWFTDTFHFIRQGCNDVYHVNNCERSGSFYYRS